MAKNPAPRTVESSLAYRMATGTAEKQVPFGSWTPEGALRQFLLSPVPLRLVLGAEDASEDWISIQFQKIADMVAAHPWLSAASLGPDWARREIAFQNGFLIRIER